MLDYRRVLGSVLLLTMLAACRGATGMGVAPPDQPSGVRTALARASLGPVSFTPIGPAPIYYGFWSGKINAYAADPANPKIMYVASGRGTGLESYSSAGTYRTTDGGKTWTPLVNGLTDANGLVSSVINALWIDPKRPAVLLAASDYDGIFRTDDGGSSWHNVYRTSQVTQFATLGTRVFAATAAGLLSSTDDGATWSVDIPATTMQPTAFGTATGTSALFAGATDGSIYSYSNANWSKVGRIPFTPTKTDGSTAAIHQMTIDPFAPSTIYASSNDGVWDQALFTSTDGGHSWREIPPKYYAVGLGAQALAFSYVHKHLLYVGVDGELLTMEGNGTTTPRVHVTRPISVADIRDVWTQPNGKDDACWVAADQGLLFVPSCANHKLGEDVRLTDSIANGLARHFAISPNAKTVLVSLQDLSSHVTSNGGATWTPNYWLYEDGFEELRPGDPTVCYAYDEAVGLSISTDSCQTFPKHPLTYTCTKICPSRLMNAPIAFDSTNPLVMYLLGGDILGAGLPTTEKAAYRSIDGGKHFAKLAWPFVEPGAIFVDGKDGAHIVVSDIANGRSSLWTTFDGGTHWLRSTGVPASAFWYTASLAPSNGNVVLASSVDGANKAYVLKSVDGGRSFIKTPFSLSVPLLRGRIDADRFESSGERGGEDASRESPLPAYIYDPVREVRFNQDAPSGVVPDVVLTTVRGAFISGNLGGTWTRIDTGTIAHGFWSIRWVKGRLYMASDGQGILRSNAVVQAP